MSNLATDAFQNALTMIGKWRARSGDAAPAFDFNVPDPPAIEPSGSLPAPAGGLLASTAALLEAGEITSATLVDRALAEIAAENDRLYAFVEILEVEARERAAQLDTERAAGKLRGPLHGIPVSVKDLYAVKGATTRAGSLAFERRDDRDATAVRRLRDAGAILIGKTSTHEFAMGVTAPQSRNPHDEMRIAGGSSSGAAIAAASGMGLAALGTDTRGSIRIPAALCGVFGFKPTFGAVSLDGVVPLSWSMDHGGVIGASAGDVATVYDALTRGRPVAETPVRAVSDIRVGLPRAAWREAEPAVRDSVETALESLRAAGVEIVDVERPSAIDFDTANLASMVVSRCEAAAYHRDLDLEQALYTGDVRAQLAAAEAATARDYLDGQRLRGQLQRDLLAVFDDVDVLLMPTVPIIAPLAEEADQAPLVLTRNVAIWNFAGFPAATVPTLPSEQGLPVGLQIVAAPHAEAVVFAVARAVERGVNAR